MWAWLDWGLSEWLTTLLQCFDIVGWVIRPVKTVGRITYIVLVQTLNPAQSINQWSHLFCTLVLTLIKECDNVRVLQLAGVWRCVQGYLFISVLVSASNDLMKLVVQSIKNDLASRNPVHINLALQCIANIGSRDMAEALGQEVPRLLVSG